jgi:hypothetical protein
MASHLWWITNAADQKSFSRVVRPVDPRGQLTDNPGVAMANGLFLSVNGRMTAAELPAGQLCDHAGQSAAA